MHENTVNIHRIINELDSHFGHRHLSVTVGAIFHDHINVKILYRKNVRITEENCWKNGDIAPGETADQSVMMKIWLRTEPRDESRRYEPPEYRLRLWLDNIYVNSYLMSDRTLADEFMNARRDMAGCLGNLTAGGYLIELGRSLRKRALTETLAQMRRLGDELIRLADGDDLTRQFASHLFYWSRDPRERLAQLRLEADVTRMYDYLLFYDRERSHHGE